MRSKRWDTDLESARAALSAARRSRSPCVCSGRDPDPAKSKEHVLLSVLAERRLLAGETAELGALMQDVLEPPIAEVRALAHGLLLAQKRAEKSGGGAEHLTRLAHVRKLAPLLGTRFHDGARKLPTAGPYRSDRSVEPREREERAQNYAISANDVRFRPSAFAR
jgi:hypothetical protein